MKHLIFTFLFLLSHLIIKGGTGNDIIGSRSTGMGNYSATLSDLWATNNNQAGLGKLTDFSAGISYENRFLLKETGLKTAVIVAPVKKGVFGVGLTSFGYSAYSQNKVGLSYGIKLAEFLYAGVQLNYLNTRLTPEYGQNNTLTAAAGLIADLSKEISIGVHVYNPTRTKLAEYDNERVPTIMKLGLEYRFSDKIFMGVEAEKDLDFDPSIKVGVEYHAVERIFFRGGISTNPTQSSFGFGVLLNNFKLDISSSFHQTLGLTPSISLVYIRKK